MQYIDLNTWKRKEHFNFFYRMDYPQFNICANIDVTKFLDFVKTKRLSFYYAMIYLTTQVVNEIINFRYRIREGQVVLHDKIHPSFTDMGKEDDLFRIVTVELSDDLFEFVRNAESKSQNQKEFFSFEDHVDRDDLIYITCIPWVSFTHLSHTISLNRDDSVPRISWGKYYSQTNRILLPFSVQVHHALVDGVHVGEYFTRLQKLLDSF
ncbi:MAG TPA: chloramphenicol acetyltransferase [Bacillota bacterium]|nr:chloramphenicol acetyltransferase [Bacillota bacterium]HOL10748.1 chloramphenicol acetyltransferase [Bacillota bacterium]HPO97229.1 chloramphenicol acetyltransferase [Bacillota bacterium]